MSDAVYAPDPVTRIYNVHWASGLAVEFGDKDRDAPTTTPPVLARRERK
jgi:hypothetical protein